MNIRPNASDNQPGPLRFDPARPSRETIQHRQPLSPEEQAALDAQRAEQEAARVKEARDEYRAQFKERVGNAREHYTANQHESLVRRARNRYEARMDERKLNSQGAGGDDKATKGSGDRIEISTKSRALIERAAVRETESDRGREERVNALREQYLEGKLNTPERVERAARAILEEQ